MNMRQVNIFFKISKIANQNKNNFMFTSLIKQVDSQKKLLLVFIALEKLKKIWICLVFI